MQRQLSRRNFLKLAGLTAGASAAVLTGCTPTAPAAPTAASGAATSAPPASQAGAPVPALLRSDAGEKEYFEKAIGLFESQIRPSKSTGFIPPAATPTSPSWI